MLDRKTEAQGRVDGLRQELIKLGQLRKANKIVSPIDGEVQQLACIPSAACYNRAGLNGYCAGKPQTGSRSAAGKQRHWLCAGRPIGEIKIDAFPYTKYGLMMEKYPTSRVIPLKMKTGSGLSRPHQIATNNGECARQSGILAPVCVLSLKLKRGIAASLNFFCRPLFVIGRKV